VRYDVNRQHEDITGPLAMLLHLLFKLVLQVAFPALPRKQVQAKLNIEVEHLQ
jgi:hypothetical protein